MTVTGFARSAMSVAWRDEIRRALSRLLLVALDCLAPPPSRFRRDAELPAEWFKYPPI